MPYIIGQQDFIYDSYTSIRLHYVRELMKNIWKLRDSNSSQGSAEVLQIITLMEKTDLDLFIADRRSEYFMMFCCYKNTL